MEVKFLPNLLGRRVDRNSGTAHAISGSAAASSGMYGSVFGYARGGWDVDQAINDALERVIWVFRCVDAIATNQSKLTMVTRKGDPIEGKIIDNIVVKKLLNQRSNDYENAQDFRYRLSAQALLSKRGAFVEVIKNGAGVPKALHLLPPGLVEPIPDPKKFVAGYRLLNQVAMEEVILPRENVLWIRTKPHPTDPYLQLTPLVAAHLAIETDWLARLYNRQFLLNDGRPGLLIAIQGQVDRGDMKELRDRLSGGPYGAGRTTVIDNAEDMNVADLGASPRDMQWLEAISGSKEDILLAFGTPESVLGNASGRTYDNADAEKENWWEETEQPHCQALGRGFDPLTGNVEDDVCVSYNWEQVDVLQRRKRARHEKKLEEFKAGLCTIDEYLEYVGRAKWNRPGTQVLMLPNGVFIGPSDDIEQAAAALPQRGQPALEGPELHAYNGAKRGTLEGQRNFENIIAGRAYELSRVNRAISKKDTLELEQKAFSYEDLLGEVKEELEEFLSYPYDDEDVIDGEVIAEDEEKVHPYEADRAMVEGLFEGALDTWGQTQANVIEGRLDHVKIRKHTRFWEGEGVGTKALDPKYAVETSRWIGDLQGAMDRFMQRIGMDTMRKTAKEMERSGIARTMHAIGRGNSQGRSALTKVYGTRADAETALSELLRPLSDVVQQAASRQSERVAGKIAELDADGASLTTIKKAVRDMVGTRSGWRQQLARYLTTALMEGAKHMTYEQAGKLMQKTWNTMEDERVRHSHEAVDGDSRLITKKFRVGKALMPYPGHPSGGVEETAGCRCWCDYDISEEGAKLYDRYA